MKTLAMDTSWNHLVIALLEDGKRIAGCDEAAPKKQSELLNVRLKQLLEKAGWKLADIDEVVITDGPGSYTGLRIAMTAAKILGSQKKIPVKTLSLMQLHAGLDHNAYVLLDARGHRAYTAEVSDGMMKSMEIVPVEEAIARAEAFEGTVYGDVHLLEGTSVQAVFSDFLTAFEQLLPLAQEVEDIDTLVPRYYKETDSYKVKG